jgi:hypothetical protein
MNELGHLTPKFLWWFHAKKCLKTSLFKSSQFV